MNYKHLHYFWATAKAGGIVKAGEQLHMSPQTLSGQIKLLEERLGCTLFRKQGRGLVLTAAGRLALGYADQIFALGAELEAQLGRAGGEAAVLEFSVGIADAVPKAIAYRLLEPALAVATPVRLVCHEGKLPELLGRLAVHRLDLVIADEPMARQLSVKAYNHPLGATAMSFLATPALAQTLAGTGFPQCLEGAPLLVPGVATALRQRLDFWLTAHQLRPRVIGEFDDAALMKAFGAEGRGVFMAPTLLDAETAAQYGVTVVGRTHELVEEFYAISVECNVSHPCVAAITQAASRLAPSIG